MQQKTLLIVDDEKGILRALRRLFRKSDLRLLIADSGEEALEILAEQDVQVILTDFRMPGMTGGQLLERASAIYPETVGMILSGYAELKAILATFDKGVVYKFLTKPWDDTNLLQEVERAFEIAMQKALELDPASVVTTEVACVEGAPPLAPEVEPLLNRQRFVAMLKAELTRGEPGALVLIDLVEARSQLRKLGLHSTLELTLRVSEQLARVDQGRGQVCHWGSNRFLLWLPHTDDYNPQDLIQFTESLSRSLQSDSNLFRVGISEARPDTPLETLIIEAQAARFSCCDSPVPLKLFDPSDALNDTELQLAAAIRAQALTLAFQPIADSSTGALVAVEALVRAPLADDGRSQPESMMIPIIADSLGLTSEYSRWLIETALRQYTELQVLPDFSAKLVLNLSLWQLELEDLCADLTRALEQAGVAPTQLQLDLSENLLINARPILRTNLEQLIQRGVELVLDDQGTAYSLLRSELKLPVQRVKLDRAFLRSLMSQPSQQEMLLHLCEVIEARGFAVSIEGVDSSDQLEFLQRRFDFQYQGTLLSAPLEQAELERWYRDRVSAS